MSTPTVLPPAALGQLVPATAPGGGSTAPNPGFVRAALRRAALYLLPVPLAVAASKLLGQVPWQVPVGAVVLGWSVVPVLRWAPTRRTPALAYSSYGAYPALLRRVGAYLLLGLAQGAVVVTVWRAGQAAVPTGGLPPPALLPLLVAVPLIELCAGWHLARLAGGLAHHDQRDRYQRYVQRLGWATLAALLPPLVAGTALAGTASRLPYRLSEHPDAPGLVLAIAGGVLLSGIIAVGWMLAARGRPLLAALVTGAPVPGALVWHASVPALAATSLSGWGQLLPATVIALAVAYAAGLVLAAQVLFDSRSH